MSRSLLYCLRKIAGNLVHLCKDCNMRAPSPDLVRSMRDELEDLTIKRITDNGLHEFLTGFARGNTALARQVEQDFRFYS